MAPHAVVGRGVGRGDQPGFTLIEVMIAMVLTAIAIMGIMALFITESKSAGFSRHITEAAVLAEDKIEYLRTQSSASIALTTETGINERGLTVTGGIFTRSYKQQPSLTAPSTAEITVTVTWFDDGGSGNHSLIVHARRNL